MTDQPIRLAQDETDPPPWVTISIHPPSANCAHAGFVDEGKGTFEVRAVDFMALQELAGDEDDDPETRIVGIVIDWTGHQVVCAVDSGVGFAGFGATRDDAEARARHVLEMLQQQAAQAATP